MSEINLDNSPEQMVVKLTDTQCENVEYSWHDIDEYATLIVCIYKGDETH